MLRTLAITMLVAVALASGCAGEGPREETATDAAVARDAGHDAGTVDDAGPDTDAGLEPDAGEPEDAGVIEDSGTPEDAGEVPDAGPEDAGTALDAGPEDAGTEVDAGTPIDDDPIIPIEGYGAATRGGWQPGRDVVFVTSLDDSGPGTLREALDSSTGPRIVRFSVEGTIHLVTPLLVPSNTTIDGRGKTIVMADKGLILVGTDDVILTHLTIENVLPTSDDGLRIGDPAGPSERVVVDHVTFRHTDGKGDSKFTDEALSVVFGSTDITIAWCRFESWEKVMLFGNGDAPQSVDGNMRITVHHNYAQDTGRRHPQARWGTFDFFNNFWNGWHMYGWYWEAPYRDAFGSHCQDSCRLRLENNLFARAQRNEDLLSRADQATSCASGGLVEELGSVTAPTNRGPLRFGVGCPAGASVPRPYTANVEPADDALMTKLLLSTGNVP